MTLIEKIIARAQSNKQRIVLPESLEERTLTAADQSLADGIAEIILIGNPDEIYALAEKLGLKHIDKATIIDPATSMPGADWRSVTVVCRDSGLADALSTALFLLPQEEGQTLLDNSGAMAMWMDRDGKLFYSPGFEEMIRT